MSSNLNDNKKDLIVLWVLAILSSVLALIPLRNTIFSCDDSISNFVLGRMTDSKFSFKFAMDFCLMRGKVGVLFPILITIRDYLYRQGNYVIYWLMQYVPVYINVFLSAVFINRKLSPKLAPVFVILFSAFLQINGWHSLITCYPIEFMYGLSMALFGVLLYDSYLSSATPRKLYMVLSVICYYESMQTYEAFLLFGLFYALLALFIKGCWKDRIKVLIPHFVTAVVYVGIFIYLNIHPVVPSIGYDVTTRGNFVGFLLTDLIFSFGMFPLADIFFPSVFNGLDIRNIDIVSIFAAIVSTLGVFVYLKSQEENVDRKKYIHAAIIGASMALCFPMMHSITSKYQIWAIEEHQFGYVPTTISYFGWIVFIVAIGGLIINQVINRKPSFKKIVITIASVVVFIVTLLTCLINSSIRINGIGPTSQKLSYRAQSMFTLVTSNQFAELNCDLLYAPDYSGVHGGFEENEFIIQHETGNGVKVTFINDDGIFKSEFNNANSPLVFRYFYDEDVGVLIIPDSIDVGSRIFVVSSHGFNGTINVDTDMGILERTVNLSRNEVAEINNIDSFDIHTLSVTS